MLAVVDRYDDHYRKTPEVFGSRPNTILVGHFELIETTSTALDIGCGQGRNSLFLARKKISVRALDPSIEAIRTVDALARAEDLPIRTIHGGFEDLEPLPGGYGAIMAFGVIPDLRRQLVTALAETIADNLAPRGVLFITGFGTWDPSFGCHRREWTEEAKNSFCSLDGLIRTYLEPGELASLFPAFEVIFSWEGLGPEHRHGDGPPERHGLAEAVLRGP
jgi:SAM-dependent methyltransferase